MRLIGSRAEDDFRRQLAASNAALRAGGDTPLHKVLRAHGVNLATAFILDWIPEQGEEIYTILDGTRQVLVIEAPRDGFDGRAEVRAIPFEDFRVSVSRGTRSRRIQFAVAMDLLREMSGKGASGRSETAL